MAETNTSIDVFVSYAHDDRDVAAKLVDSLAAEGWSVWWDTELAGGARFDQAIAEALNAAKCVVVIWSPASVESDFVFDEARTANQRNVMVPAVIGSAKVPLGFGRIQSVDLDRSDGTDRLKQAVRAVLKHGPKPAPKRKLPPAALIGGAMVAAAALAAIFWLRPSYEAQFRELRAQGSAASSTKPAMVGVTVWQLRPSIAKDPPHTRMLTEPAGEGGSGGGKVEWTPVRVRPGADLPEGSRVRLGIESSRDGYLYIIDRELGSDGSVGPPRVVYPTERTRAGVDAIRRGESLQLPPPTAAVQYWELKATRPDYAGELLSIIVSPQRIAELAEAGSITDERIGQWQKEWNAGVQRVYAGPEGGLLTPGEGLARVDPSHVLTESDAAPSAIYTRGGAHDVPLLVNHSIRIASRAP